MQMTRRSWRG